MNNNLNQTQYENEEIVDLYNRLVYNVNYNIELNRNRYTDVNTNLQQLNNNYNQLQQQLQTERNASRVELDNLTRTLLEQQNQFFNRLTQIQTNTSNNTNVTSTANANNNHHVRFTNLSPPTPVSASTNSGFLSFTQNPSLRNNNQINHNVQSNIHHINHFY